MTEHRPAPPVTITGGPTAAALPEVTDDEPDRDPDPRRVRRRRLTLVLLGLTLLSALGVAELRDSRATA